MRMGNTNQRDRIKDMEERIELLEGIIQKYKDNGCDAEDYVDYQIEIEELKSDIRYAWHVDEMESLGLM